MNTILAKGYVNIRDEKVAAGAITPGMLVERTSTDQVQAHATAGGRVNALFALEDENQGNDIDDVYPIGSLVTLWKPVSGEQVYAIADDTASGAIVIGDLLESVGNGRVRKLTTGLPFAVALEAVTPEPSSPRILIEIA